MLETRFFGKLLPTQPDIRPILIDVRAKYQIPEIGTEDNGLKVLLKHQLEINWQAITNLPAHDTAIWDVMRPLCMR